VYTPAIDQSIADEVARRFPAADVAGASALLDTLKIGRLHDSPSLRFRVKMAAVRHSGGSLTKLKKAIDLGLADWRDLLVAAGLGNDDWRHVLVNSGATVPAGV
jgi:hypothetical protein